MIGPARTVKGGVSAVVNNLYEAGLDRQADLRYIATMEDGSKGRKLWVAIKALFTFIFALGNYDIVHVNMASDISIYRKMPFIWIAHWRKKKIIIHQHGGNIEEFYFHQCTAPARKRIKRTLKMADKLLVIAPYLQEVFERIIDRDKIILMPNSVFIQEGVDKDYEQMKLLFLGRLCKEKGIKELLSACAKLKTEFPELKLYLGGVWEDEKLKEMADELSKASASGMADIQEGWIHQLGWVGPKEKDWLLRECNLFLLPSWFEGHPVSLMEGMAYGCACIATDIGGISQMITHGQNGLLIPVKDEEALREAIQAYLKDNTLQKKLGIAAAEKIKNNYNIGKNLQKLVEIYKTI